MSGSRLDRDTFNVFLALLKKIQALEMLDDHERKASLDVASWLEGIAAQTTAADDPGEVLEPDDPDSEEDTMKCLLRSYRSMYNTSAKSFTSVSGWAKRPGPCSWQLLCRRHACPSVTPTALPGQGAWRPRSRGAESP